MIERLWSGHPRCGPFFGPRGSSHAGLLTLYRVHLTHLPLAG